MPTEIFISYRSEDQAVADAIKRGIEHLAGPSSVEVHIAAHMWGSVAWRGWIADKISRSSALLFLYTDKHADWTWCMYEIGMFRGTKVSGSQRDGSPERPTGIGCIKDADIPHEDLPPQLHDLQVYDATESGLMNLFEELIFKGTYTNGKALRERPSVNDREGSAQLAQQIRIIVDETVQSFRHRTTFFRYRLEISLCQRQGREVKPLTPDEWGVSGTREAMMILGTPAEGERWPRLYRRLKSAGAHNVAWLDDLRREIIEIGSRQDDTIDDPVLQPFRSGSTTYIPVVSRTETFRERPRQVSSPRRVSEAPGDPNVIPSKVFVILVPAKDQLVGFRTFADFFAPDSCTVYPPTGVVRVRWKRKSSGMGYTQEDLDGEPVICGANPKFRQLFNHAGEVPHPDGPQPWTQLELLKRVDDFVDDDVMLRLREDQDRLARNILFREEDDRASAPLQILTSPKRDGLRLHPHVPGRAFLPYLMAKQRVGRTTEPHEQYLLVSFIEVS